MRPPNGFGSVSRGDWGAFDPTRLEEQYQELCHRLDRRATAAWHLAQIAHFLWRCPSQHPGVEAYVLDLEGALRDAAEQFDPIGWHPDALRALAATLNERRTEHPDLDAPLEPAERQIRRNAARLYAYAGALTPAFDVLLEATVAGIDPAPRTSPPRDQLRELQGEAPASVAPILQSFDDTWMEAFGPGAAPIVESTGTQRWLDPVAPVGGVLDVRIDLLGTRTEDHLTVEGYRPGLLTLEQSGLDAPVNAARQMLHDVRSVDAKWAGRICLVGSEGRAAGASIHLAVAVHMYAAVLHSLHTRIQTVPREGVLLTGRMQSDGTVGPVSATSIPLKVQTAFFSPATHLVVASSQADAARSACEDLRDDFPNGDLTVLGVDRLAEVYYDRRLTAQTETGRVQHTLQRAWRRRAGVTSAAIIVVLVALLGWMTFGPIDQNPVTVDFAGEQMVLSNAAGVVVERIEVGESVANQQEKGKYGAYSLYDVTGDGRNDICWVHDPDGVGSDIQTLRCKEIGAEEPLWSRPLKYSVSFPRKPEVIGERFGANSMSVGNFDGDAQVELFLTAAHRPYFPGLLLTFDAQSGEERARYLHPGHLKQILPYDLNDDGITELLVCGVSNAFETAVLAVLDPRSPGGHAPTRGEYVMDGLPSANEVAYVRIPPTKVHRTQSDRQNSCRNIGSFPSEGRFVVSAGDGFPRKDDSRPYIIVHFNDRLEPQAVGTTDQYDHLSEQLVEAGQLDRAPDFEYFQQYMKQLRYWNGSGWQSEPVMMEPSPDTSR
jgi:hypothetical protein